MAGGRPWPTRWRRGLTTSIARPSRPTQAGSTAHGGPGPARGRPSAMGRRPRWIRWGPSTGVG